MAIHGKSVLAVIPARGGSKRVPRKNLREFRGRSLLVWAAEAAIRSKYIDDIAISTEDLEIGAVGHALTGLRLIARSPLLATDDASSEDVLREALAESPADWIVLLQPTSPLRTSEDIDACIERAQIGNGCISVGPDGLTNGAVYVATREWIMQHDFSHMGLMKYRMDADRSLDIDYPEDFLK